MIALVREKVRSQGHQAVAQELRGHNQPAHTQRGCVYCCTLGEGFRSIWSADQRQSPRNDVEGKHRRAGFVLRPSLRWASCRVSREFSSALNCKSDV